jgi:hypothetical protein
MMAKRIYGYIKWTIQNLTNDEDIQQELWLYFLEGNYPFTLQEQYKKIVKMQEIQYGFEEKL